MPNEHNAFDLSRLLDNKGNRDRIERNREQRLGETDRSGRPWPKDVRVKLISGVVVNCAVLYDGLDLDGDRRFVVLAEIDWENYPPTHLIVGEYPRDCTLIFRVPNVPDDECSVMAAGLELVAERIVDV